MAVGIRFDRVSKSFGAVRAVDDVTIDVRPGELFFLLGPSGCGKTTLLRCLAGFCEPDSGAIRIGERDVTGIPPCDRDAAMVFQSYALWPHLTVRENVAFGLEMRRCSREETARRVGEALETVRMTEKAAARPNELSGGQQQRVALARALVVRPQCLLLDEPLSNLDAKLRLEMRGEIRRICKDAGLTAVYVTHDQKEALAMADRMAVLADGRVRQIGAPQEVYAAPASRFVAGFIGEANFIEATVERVDAHGVHAATAMGPIRAPAPGGSTLIAGRAVTLCVRPEAVRFGEPPRGAAGSWAGTVHGTVYLGETAQHQVSVAGPGGETRLKAFEIKPSLIARDEARTARVWFDSHDVIVLAD
jgi:iron(III) transport system ATP-binding protein